VLWLVSRNNLLKEFHSLGPSKGNCSPFSNNDPHWHWLGTRRLRPRRSPTHSLTASSSNLKAHDAMGITNSQSPLSRKQACWDGKLRLDWTKARPARIPCLSQNGCLGGSTFMESLQMMSTISPGTYCQNSVAGQNISQLCSSGIFEGIVASPRDQFDLLILKVMEKSESKDYTAVTALGLPKTQCSTDAIWDQRQGDISESTGIVQNTGVSANSDNYRQSVESP